MRRTESPPWQPSSRPAFSGRRLAALLLTVGLAVPAARAASKNGEVVPRTPLPLPVALDSSVRSARQVSKSVGVHVVDLDSGGTVYSWDGDTPKIIASNTKLFTTAA